MPALELPKSDGVEAAPNSNGVDAAPNGELELAAAAGVEAAPNREAAVCGWPKGVAGVDAPAKLNAEELATGVAKLKLDPAAALLAAPPKLKAIFGSLTALRDDCDVTDGPWH